MLNTQKNMAKIIRRIAESTLKRDANSTTCLAIYQPKVPKQLNKFKHTKND